MRKITFLSLLLMALAFVQTAQAKDITIYVKADNGAPHIHYWGAVTGVDEVLSSTVTINGVTFYYMTFEGLAYDAVINYLFYNGSYGEGNQTADITNISTTKFYTYNGGAGYDDVTDTYEANITEVKLPGNYCSWSAEAMTVSNKYTYTYDLELENSNPITLKLLVNGENWLGWGNLNFNVLDGWIQEGATDGNIQLNVDAIGATTYHITASWGGGLVASENWTLTITADSYNAVRTVQLPGSFNGWVGTQAVFTRVNNTTYTYKLDLSDQGDDDVQLKLLVNGTHYLGYNDLTLTDSNGWLSDAGNNNNNNLLLTPSSSSNKKYDITATWVESDNPSAGWTFEITEGTGVTGTFPSSGWSSLACKYPLDFSSADNLTNAFVVSSITSSTVYLESVDEITAGNAVLLKGTSGATYSIPLKKDATFSGTNKLQAAVTSTAIAANEAYILKNGAFCLVTAASAVPAGKAYLLASDVPAPARSLSFAFGDEGDTTTGVTVVRGETEAGHGEFFDMQGRRVATPTKGLYIINGKKVVVK